MVPRNSQGGRRSPHELPVHSTSATRCSLPCLPDHGNNEPARSPSSAMLFFLFFSERPGKSVVCNTPPSTDSYGLPTPKPSPFYSYLRLSSRPHENHTRSLPSLNSADFAEFCNKNFTKYLCWSTSPTTDVCALPMSSSSATAPS